MNTPHETAAVAPAGKVMRHCPMFVDEAAVNPPVRVDLLPSALIGATWWVAESELAVAMDALRGVGRDGLLQGGGRGVRL